MSRSGKIWLGVFTFLPALCFLLYMVILFGTLFITFSEIDNGNEDPSFLFVGGFMWMFLSLILGVIISLGLYVYYIIHILKNQKFDSTMKLIWILVLIFASVVGAIIYYFVEIIPRGKETSD